MGQNNGKILKISESQLELKEIVPDGLGGWVERFSTLTVNE
jgi:type IV pilus assembly protein PilP